MSDHPHSSLTPIGEPANRTLPQIEDVSGYCFTQRHRHYFQQYSGSNSPKNDNDMVLWDLAWKTAAEEMIDEQHTMLRAFVLHFGLIKADQ